MLASGYAASKSASEEASRQLRLSGFIHRPSAGLGHHDIQVVACFSRIEAEPLPDYLNRAQKLRHRVRLAEHRQMLASNLLMYLSDEPDDAHI
jgi:hypothetical protein